MRHSNVSHPNPFAANHTRAYEYPRIIAGEWADRAIVARQAGNALSTMGVAWNSVGVSFPPGWNFNGSAMNNVLRPFVLESGNSWQRAQSRTVLQHDFVARRRGSFSGDGQRPTPYEAKLMKSLAKRGFARFDLPELGRLLRVGNLSTQISADLATAEATKRRDAARSGRLDRFGALEGHAEHTEALRRAIVELTSTLQAQLDAVVQWYFGGQEIRFHHHPISLRLPASLRSCHCIMLTAVEIAAQIYGRHW